MDWIGLAENMGRWRAFVNAVVNHRDPLNVRNFSTGWEPVASQEGMCSMELIQSLVTSHWVSYTLCTLTSLLPQSVNSLQDMKSLQICV